MEASRGGKSVREIARDTGWSISNVHRWIQRARGRRLDRVDFSDKPPGSRRAKTRTKDSTERLVLSVRNELRKKSALGEYGAHATRRELLKRGVPTPPSLRTIGRIFERHGALDGNRRRRFAPPPPGWYLPRAVGAFQELDSFDIIEGLVIKGGFRFEVLNAISLQGSLAASWPCIDIVNTDKTIGCMIGHWKEFGLPLYAQFDNDTIFQGAQAHPDVVGRVIRMCLSLGVTPVFAPPRQVGFQAKIENYNGQWEDKVWARFKHKTFLDMLARSDAYAAAKREHFRARIDTVPRRPFPTGWTLDLTRQIKGKIIYLRKTNNLGQAIVLGRAFTVDEEVHGRLVRAEVDLDESKIRFYRLRRVDPANHELLREVPYTLPNKG